MIGSKNLNLIFYIWVPNNNRGRHEKTQLKQHFATNIKHALH